MPNVRAVSSDSHVIEPHDLWLERLDGKFRDKAPRAIADEQGEHWFHYEGKRSSKVRPLGTPFAVQGTQAEEARTGGWDPAARLKDMEVDGIEAEVLYPSLAMSLFALKDAELQVACFRAYNDWLAEFCRGGRGRLYGVGLVPLYNVEDGLAEVRRIVDIGLSGVAIWGTPPLELSFLSARYDPFWAGVQSLKLPVSLHCFTGHLAQRPNNFMAGYTISPHEIQTSLATLIFGGVFERFGDLKVISVENDLGWAPYLMQRMDYGQRRKGGRRGTPFASGLTPSERFKRNVRCTFMTDSLGIKCLDLLGADVPMWATDYPHDDSTWPNSQQVI
ncbi:MAG: amidohydrolase family protein, partial [Chloroflexi bacterium]|nr:amidohydrolase family protein [Chloroflexota bacterium]